MQDMRGISGTHECPGMGFKILNIMDSLRPYPLRFFFTAIRSTIWEVRLGG